MFAIACVVNKFKDDNNNYNCKVTEIDSQSMLSSCDDGLRITKLTDANSPLLLYAIYIQYIYIQYLQEPHNNQCGLFPI